MGKLASQRGGDFGGDRSPAEVLGASRLGACRIKTQAVRRSGGDGSGWADIWGPAVSCPGTLPDRPGFTLVPSLLPDLCPAGLLPPVPGHQLFLIASLLPAKAERSVP